MQFFSCRLTSSQLTPLNQVDQTTPRSNRLTSGARPNPLINNKSTSFGVGFQKAARFTSLTLSASLSARA